jgi:hypothetical protein
MHQKKEKISLFIFIDAFGWEIRKRHDFFLKEQTTDSKKLETILGYSSACDPSIISGLLPSQHKLWSSFYYDPDGCPYKWTRFLHILPDALFRRGRVRHYMSKLIKKICGFTGYFQIYGVPFNELPLFNYAEKRRIWEPGGLPVGKTIFDRMTEKGIPYYVHDSDVSDEVRIERLMSAIQTQSIDFAYCSLGRLDALLHAEWNDDPKVEALLKWYDSKLRAMLDAASENYETVHWYLFTDHGMHDIQEGYDLIADIEKLGLRWNKDYVAFYDSTMARFWFLDEKSREPITRALTDHPKGRILPDKELQELGIFFEDGMYGDLIFLLNSNIQMVPSFMGVKQLKGMHGFHPHDPDSYASIASNTPIPETVQKIHHIHSLMLNELALEPES